MCYSGYNHISILTQFFGKCSICKGLFLATQKHVLGKITKVLSIFSAQNITLFVLDQLWLSILPFSRNSAIEWLSHLPTDPVNTIKPVQKFLSHCSPSMTVKGYVLLQKVPLCVLVVLADITEISTATISRRRVQEIKKWMSAWRSTNLYSGFHHQTFQWCRSEPCNLRICHLKIRLLFFIPGTLHPCRLDTIWWTFKDNS